MPVLVERIAETDVNCLIWFGRVSKSEALGLPGRVDPSRAEFGHRWISYFDPTADLSELDRACLLELQERLRPVVGALAAKGDFKMMLVSNSKFNVPLLAAWGAINATDEAYPSSPVVVRDVQAAAQALGLSAAEAGLARRWIETRIAGAP